jgi:hypothetical protein
VIIWIWKWKPLFRIDADGNGEFQFGLVSGQINGELVINQADE